MKTTTRGVFKALLCLLTASDRQGDNSSEPTQQRQGGSLRTRGGTEAPRNAHDAEGPGWRSAGLTAKGGKKRMSEEETGLGTFLRPREGSPGR